MPEWRKVSLASICDHPQYGAIAKGGAQYSGPLFIRQTDIVAGSIDWTSVPRCDLGHSEFSKYAVHEGDILISRLGAGVGNAAVVAQPNGAVFAGYLVRFRADPETADPRFVGYHLRSQAWRDHVNGFSSGAAQPTLNAQQMGAYQLSLPPLAQQRAIAGILASLDDKIDLNRRMNETLEAIAGAMYKSWFVDFDPVRAKMRGERPVGMDAATAALFPSKLAQTEHGDVPEGWSLRPLDTVATFLNGLALQKFPAGDGPSLPVIKIAEMRAGVTAKSDRAAMTIPPQYIIDDGDLLFSWSGSLDIIVWTGGRGALNQHLFKVSSPTFPSWFLLGGVRQHLPNFQAIAASKATTMGHIQRHHLTEALVAVPPLDVITQLGRTLGPIHEKLVANSREAKTLAELRDTLLPRLLSGELRVGDPRASEAA